MSHYHIVSAANSTVPISSVRYDNYEDSIVDWVNLSTKLFGHLEVPGELAIENAKAATGNGDGIMARIGTSALCFYWMRCESVCYSTTWN